MISQIRGWLCWFEMQALRRNMPLIFMRRKNIRTFVSSCLQEVIVGLQASADRDQENLWGLILAQIPQTVLCGLSPLKKMELNICCRELLGFLARERIFLPCFLNREVKGPREKGWVKGLIDQLGKKTD